MAESDIKLHRSPNDHLSNDKKLFYVASQRDRKRIWTYGL